MPVKLEAQDFLHEADAPAMLPKAQEMGPNTDSPPGMPTPPNIMHPPPQPPWHSDDNGQFSPDAEQPDFRPLGTISQQAAPQQGQAHIHMPLSPFKAFAQGPHDPMDRRGSLDRDENTQPHVVGVLETQGVPHPLARQHGHQDPHGGLGRAISCLTDAQHHAGPWDGPVLTGHVVSRCNSAPPVPEVSLMPSLWCFIQLYRQAISLCHSEASAAFSVMSGSGDGVTDAVTGLL